MAQKKTMKITFPHGGIVPASELRPVKKGAFDLQVSAHMPVTVSGAYGQQLVDDKFAVEFDGAQADADADVNAKDKADADAKSKADADAKAKADADAKQKADDAAKAQADADAKAKADADADADAKAKAAGNA